MDCDAEKLIFLVKKAPEIYDCSLKEHSVRTIVDKLWENIAKEMKWDVTTCKFRWTTLRNTYARALRQEQAKRKFGTKGKLKKIWYLKETMAFMRDHMKHQRIASSTLKETSTLKSENPRSNESLAIEESDDDSSELLARSVMHSPLTSSQSFDQGQQQTLPPPYPPFKKKKTALDRITGPMIEFLQARTCVEKDSPNLLFFKSLLPDSLLHDSENLKVILLIN